MTMRTFGGTTGDGREATVLVLAAAGWLYMLSHLLSMAAPGTLAQAGPGMQVLELARRGLGANDALLELNASLCVTAGGAWTMPDFARAVGMWMAMVLAMMLPTLLWSRLPRDGAGFCRFIGGYSVAWAPFCVLAALCQWLLRHQGLLNEHMVSTSRALDVFVVGLIGVSYLKRDGFRQVARHIARQPWPGSAASARGFSCGLAASWTCVPIMASMFVLGLMNLVAMAALTGIMLVQAHGASRRAPARA